MITQEEFKANLWSGEIKFKYKKQNGEERTATGTLNPEIYGEENTPKGTGYQHNENQIRYFDLDSDGWRSFIWENFIEQI